MLSSEVRQWCPMQRDPTTISPPAAAISLSQASKPSHNLAFRLQLSSQWEGFTPSLPTRFLQQVFEIGRYVYFGSIKKGNYVQVVVSFSGQSSTQAIVACIQEGGSGGWQMVIFKRSAVGNSQHGQVVISAERPVVTLFSITWPLLLRMMMTKMIMMIMMTMIMVSEYSSRHFHHHSSPESYCAWLWWVCLFICLPLVCGWDWWTWVDRNLHKKWILSVWRNYAITL